MVRLLPKSSIPITLWDEESSIMHLPPKLIGCWEMLLQKHGLIEQAGCTPPKGSFEGGMGQQATNDHFAWRFNGSCARVMLSILDPEEKLSEISDAYARVFSGNKVFLCDLPCGSGAASLSILTTIFELRKQNILPRMPLEIIIVGGEISKPAQNYAIQGLDFLLEELKTQAIFVSFDVQDWDVCNPFSNSDLIKHMTLVSQDCAARLLILANFSGFLEREKKWKEAYSQFEELFRHSRDSESFAIWIEPGKNNVKNSFMPRVIDWFKQTFASIFNPNTSQEETIGESK